ncbi:MAG: hypothetical protein LAP21_07320 [Acidobacteriia bacterium]|nr:hypothetical protein [Terriglobia bacterium]
MQPLAVAQDHILGPRGGRRYRHHGEKEDGQLHAHGIAVRRTKASIAAATPSSSLLRVSSAGDATVFPEQLAGPTRVNETLLDGLQPWQPKKIYYFSDASSDTLFQNSGPSYPSTAISPSRKLPYWRLALDAFRFHRTQYRSFIERLDAMDEQHLAAQSSNWGQPMQLTLGRSNVGGTATGDVFEGITAGRIAFTAPARTSGSVANDLSVELGGPWSFYERFRRAHGLEHLPKAAVPEISIKRGGTLTIPLDLHNHTDTAKTVKVSVTLPDGWKVQNGAANPETLAMDPQGDYYLQMLIEAPQEGSGMQQIQCRAESEGKTLAAITISVRLASGGLPQQ